jgi:hypothetical protein
MRTDLTHEYFAMKKEVVLVDELNVEVQGKVGIESVLSEGTWEIAFRPDNLAQCVLDGINKKFVCTFPPSSDRKPLSQWR